MDMWNTTRRNIHCGQFEYTHVNSHRIKTCNRCGIRHIDGQCRALSAKCNFCAKKGHYARVCTFRKSVNSPVKSEKTKQRDAARMTAFINRKTAELVFPFQHLNNSHFMDNTTNTSLLSHGYVRTVISSIADEAQEIIHELCCENKTLKEKVLTLQQENNVLYKKTCEIKQKDTEIQDLKSQLEDSEFKCSMLEDEFQKLEIVNQRLGNGTELPSVGCLHKDLEFHIDCLEEDGRKNKEEKEIYLIRCQELERQFRTLKQTFDEQERELNYYKNKQSRNNVHHNKTDYRRSNKPPRGFWARRGH